MNTNSYCWEVSEKMVVREGKPDKYAWKSLSSHLKSGVFDFRN
ncbi:MAG: hypothetical protein ABI844_04580 [Saprospiraceae bacterium]